MFKNVDWQIVKRFALHAILVAGGAAFMYIEQWVTGHNFGSYQVLAMAINTIVFNAVEKFFFDQGAPLPAQATTQPGE